MSTRWSYHTRRQLQIFVKFSGSARIVPWKGSDSESLSVSVPLQWTVSERWQFSLRKNEDITSTWLLQLTATSDMTALDHFITCCSLEHNHPHLSCTPLPTVLSLRGIFIHEENIRENIQLTMTGLAVDLSWLNSSYTEILPTAFGWITANGSAAFLKSFIRHRYRSWVGYFSGFNRVIDML